jgi:hypothetical protein
MDKAALILQHGEETKYYEMAHKLAQGAFDKGYKEAEWLSKATYDRWQMSMGKPQKYGTQLFNFGSTKK